MENAGKPWYSRWWVFVIGGILIIGIAGQFIEPRTEQDNATTAPELQSVEAEFDIETFLSTLIEVRLDEVEETLLFHKIDFVTFDIQRDRGVWVSKNWIVESATYEDKKVVLGLRHEDDPLCWQESPKCEWVTLIEYSSTEGDVRSQRFELQGVQTRIQYTVSADSHRDGFRVVDIYFQDESMHTEASSIDTIINVDDPIADVEYVGIKKGIFFVWFSSIYGTVNPSVQINVQELLPKY